MQRTQAFPTSRATRLGRRMAAAGFLSTSIVAGLVLNNTVAWWPTSSETFRATLRSTIRAGTDWLVANPERGNPALLHMVADMSQLADDSRLQGVVDQYLETERARANYVWTRLVDGNAPVNPPPASAMSELDSYQRWILYGLAPNEIQLPLDDLGDLLSPDKFWWGTRTHQLFALLVLRRHEGRTETLDRLIDHLCEGIAFEANWDVRVTDLSFQRVAFLLAADRPDLVKPRWIERLLASQQQDGGWLESWHGWGPGLFDYTFGASRPSSHASVQALWAAYMLEYRYPEWIEQHYD